MSSIDTTHKSRSSSEDLMYLRTFGYDRERRSSAKMAGETINSNEFTSSKWVKICPDAPLGWITALMITLASRTARSTSLLAPSFARAVLRFVRDPVQDIAESLANFQSRNFLSHVKPSLASATIIVVLVAYVKYPQLRTVLIGLEPLKLSEAVERLE